MRTGSLVQTFDINLRDICYVDVNERHVFVCEPTAVHVYLRADGTEALRIPNDVAVVRVESANIIPRSPDVEAANIWSGDTDIVPLSMSPGLEDTFPDFIAGPCTLSPLEKNLVFILCFFFWIAHVSRDGRDLVVLCSEHRILLVRDFERICRGETTLKDSGHALRIEHRDVCCYLGFEHGRFCVATVRIPHFIYACPRSICLVAPRVLLLHPRLWPFGESRVCATLQHR